MRIDHPSERDFGNEPRVTIAEAMRCYCFSSSKASTASTPTTATDEAVLSQVSGQSINATDQAVAPNLSGSAASKSNVGGLQITDAQGGVNITTSDSEVVGAALQAVADIAARSQTSVSDSASSAVGAVSQLAATRLTGGETNRDKTVLYIGVAGFAALAYLATRK